MAVVWRLGGGGGTTCNAAAALQRALLCHLMADGWVTARHLPAPRPFTAKNAVPSSHL